DTDLVARLMASLAKTGAYQVPPSLKKRLDDLFFAACCNDEGTKRAIGAVWQKYGYLMDTHTAVAYDAAQQYKAACPSHAPVVILSTASPYKFPTAVLEALGEDPSADEFAAMDRLEESSGVPLPKNLRGLRERPVRHRDVIEPKDMLSYVLEKAIQKEW
ncbi:MAG: threonine synthase, partial [Clostridia bacterium]|nr:threonine synthase [Clostridia bacterium]